MKQPGLIEGDGFTPMCAEQFLWFAKGEETTGQSYPCRKSPQFCHANHRETADPI